MDLLRSVYGTLSTVVTGPRKRRPEQVFRTKDDVHRLLLSECMRRVSDEQINALKEAFEVRADGERHWTHDTLFALLAEEGNHIPHAAEASELLWRLLISLAAFPFPRDCRDALDQDGYLRACGILRYGPTILSEPGYSLDRPPRRPSPRTRRRGRPEEVRFVFQSLMNVPSEDSVDRPCVSTKDSIDLIDVMAVCMKVDDDKFVWYAHDFAAAVTQLSDPCTSQTLERMDEASYALLMQLVYSICGMSLNTMEDQTVEQDLGHASREQVSRNAMSLAEFSKAIEQNMPDIHKVLAKYLLHVIASPLPNLQRVKFVRKAPAVMFGTVGKIDVADGSLG